MPPKQGHARKTSATTRSAAPNHVTPSPPPMTLMGRPKKLSGPVQLALLPVIAMATSALLYTVAESVPGVDMRQLSTVTREPVLWRQLVPTVTRIVILYTQWAMGFDAVNTFAVTLHIRLPFYFLLYMFYNISLQTITASAIIDATSCAVAFLALSRRRPIDYASKAAATSRQARVLYNTFNVLLLTALATAIFGVSTFATAKTPYFRMQMIYNFDVPTLERLNEFMLPGFLILSVPLGWSLREYLFGPATEVDSKDSRRNLTHSLSNRTIVLAMLTFVETFSRTYTAIEGSTVDGSLKWATYWSVLICIVSTALTGAGAAAEDEEIESGDELELRETVVVPERKARISKGTRATN